MACINSFGELWNVLHLLEESPSHFMAPSSRLQKRINTWLNPSGFNFEVSLHRFNMRLTLLSSLAAFALFSLAYAKPAPFCWNPAYQSEVYACHAQIADEVVFCNATLVNAYLCMCTNNESIASIAGCLYQLDEASYPQSAAFAVQYCSDYYANITETQFADALTYYQESAIDFDDAANYTVGGVITRPVKFDPTTTDLYYKGYYQFMNNFNLSDYFGFALMGYWMLVLFFYSLSNWLQYLFPSVFVRSRESSMLKQLKRYVVLPATYGYNKQQVVGSERFGGFFQMLMPSRLESVVLLGFLGLSLAFLGADMQYIEGNPIYTAKGQCMQRYLADRSGIIGTVAIPLILLFSGRNNVLLWITGVNFATFITYHKWMARVFMSMIIIHSVCWTILERHYFAYEAAQTYFLWGIVGTVAGGLMLAQSMLFFRRNWYEIFLLLHIALAVIFIVGTWIHVVDLGYTLFMYISIGIWVFDRFVRIGRLFVFGFPRTDVKLINGDLLRIEVPICSWWKPQNGGFAYLYFLSKSKFYQSHPYTYVQLENQINFYIKVKEGITQTLQSELLSLPDNIRNMRVTVEGPYGGGLESCNVKNYHRAVFLAGGNGIPWLFSEAMHLGVQRDMKQEVKLIWIIRDYNALNWFWKELMMLQGSKVEVDIYVTRPETKLIGYVAELDESDEDGSKKEKESGSENETEKGCSLDQQVDAIKHSFPHITFIHSRPSMAQIIEEEEQGPGNSMAVVACGHPKMVDEARFEIAKRTSDKRVDFYEHLQIWA